jgi:Pyridine nucleotide-disulphide oxidoreductase
MPDTQVAIVGAGPYGLAVSAYLRGAGIDSRTFGQPMGSWQHDMPAGMLLRSPPRSSHIADPKRALGLDAWSAETGGDASHPIAVESFVAYGRWFQERTTQLDTRQVRQVAEAANGFVLSLEDGSTLEAEHVVVAAGIKQFAQRPKQFEGLRPDLVSHSFDHEDFERFAGRDVLIVGGGQSALESAALLAETGARPRLVVRKDKLRWLAPFAFMGTGPRAWVSTVIRPPIDIGGRVSGWMAAAPQVFRHLSASDQAKIDQKCVTPAGAHWLPQRLVDVPVDLGREVAETHENADSLTVTYDDGAEHTVDHAILCTGYRIDVSRYEFLAPPLLERLEIEGGAAPLGRGLESAVPGLHFAGASAAPSFGPIMRFVVGTWYAAPAISSRISGKRQRPAHLSYRPRI